MLVEDSDLVEAVAYNIEDEIEGVTAMTAATIATYLMSSHLRVPIQTLIIM